MRKSVIAAGITIFLVFFGFVFVNAPEARAGDTSPLFTETTELEGTWVGEEQGTAGTWTWTFTGNDGTSESGDTTYISTFVLDTTKDPKWIDTTITSNTVDQKYNGEVSLGIYKLEGNTLTITSNEPGLTTRPTDFSGVEYPLWILTKEGVDGEDGTDGEIPTGTKLGPFKYSDGKVIRSGTVMVSPGTRGGYTATTDGSGYATFTEVIPEGNYSLKVKKDGKVLIKSNLTMDGDGTPTYDGSAAPPASAEEGPEEEEKEEKEEAGFIPGFEAPLILLGMLVGLFVLEQRRRK